MRRSLFVGISLLLLVIDWAPSEAWAYSFWRNPSNGRVRQWMRDRFPLKVVLHPDGCPTIPKEQLTQLVTLAFHSWNGVTCTLARLTGGTFVTGYNAPSVDGINMIKFISSAQDWQWGAGEILKVILTTKTRTGEITDADLLFNSWKFKFGTSGKSDEVDFQSALTHALGRALGLGYSEVATAVMAPSLNLGSISKRNLQEDDKKAICDLYPKDAPCKERELVGNTHYCYNGRVTPICPAYSEVCKPCNRNEDCRGERVFCLQSIDSGVCGMECDARSSCPEGYSCRKILGPDGKTEIGANCAPVDGTCTNAAKIPCCRNNDDCLPGFACELQQCVKGTTTDPCKGLCKSTEQCVNGKCEVRGCNSDEQCGVGWSCRNSRCVQDGGCAGGCLPGQVCSDGTCAGDVGADCSKGEACASGLQCATGAGLKFCSKPCTSASDCANGTFCVSGLSGGSLTMGCWPASRAVCEGGSCKPKRSGCGCNSTQSPPILEGLLLLLFGLILLTRRRMNPGIRPCNAKEAQGTPAR